MDTLWFAWQVAAFALGGAVGSFAANAAVRIPVDLSLWDPPSHCAVCETPLAWHDNIPVVSWLLLRARCRHCGTPIPAFYPLIELTGACLGWLLLRRFVPSPHALDLAHLSAFGVYLLFVAFLLVAAYTDLRSYVIPEGASLYAIPVGIGTAVLLEAVGYVGWLDGGWRDAALGAFLGAGVPALFAGAWRLIVGGTGMGRGDIWLLGMIGAFLGAVPLLAVLLLGSLLGAAGALVSLAVRRSTGWLPFGPALALAAVVHVLYGDVLFPAVFPHLSILL